MYCTERRHWWRGEVVMNKEEVNSVVEDGIARLKRARTKEDALAVAESVTVALEQAEVVQAAVEKELVGSEAEAKAAMAAAMVAPGARYTDYLAYVRSPR